MKKILFICAFLLISAHIFSQGYWHLQNPIPMSGSYIYLFDVSCPSDSVCYVVGDDGWQDIFVLKTTDQGKTWLSTKLPSPNDYPYMESIDFADDLHGCVVGQGGYIATTSDGGLTWKKRTSGTSYQLHSVDFVTPQKGWAVGGALIQTSGVSVILATTDGGATWTKQNPPSGDILYDVSFADEKNGWAVAYYSGTVLKTTDGGALWIPTVSLGAEIYSVYFVSQKQGWAGGYAGQLFHTSDGGIVWVQQNNPNVGTTRSIYDIGFRDSLNGWAVGSTLMRTTDGGTQWTAMSGEDISSPYAYGVSISPEKNTNAPVIAAGYDCPFYCNPMVLAADQKSDEWKSLVHDVVGGFGGFSDIKFSDSLRGFTVGYKYDDTYSILYPLVARTTDGGIHWEQESEDIGQEFSLQSFAFLSPENLVAVGSNGSVLKRTNPGGTASWRTIEIGSESEDYSSTTFYSVYFFDSKKGILVGSGAIILKTVDGGETWKKVPSGFDEGADVLPIFTNITFTDPRNGWIVGGGDDSLRILVTHDGGLNWKKQNINIDEGGYLLAVQFLDSLHGYTCGYDPGFTKGFYITTKNGGKTWDIPAELPYEGPLISLAFTDPSHGWIGAYNNINYSGVLIATTDGGKTWVPEPHDYLPYQYFSKLFFLNPKQAWAAGSPSMILKYEPPKNTAVTVPDVAPVVNKNLLLNFPNPFSSKTTILIPPSIDSGGVLEIRDILGRMMYFLPVEKGQRQIAVDASIFPEGLYLYNLKTKGTIFAGMMTVVR